MTDSSGIVLALMARAAKRAVRDINTLIMNLNAFSVDRCLSALLLLFSLVLSGCEGVKFSPAPVDSALPPSFSDRVLYPAGIAGYHIENLAGAIVAVPSTGNPIQIGIIQPAGYTPSATPITDTDSYYDSLVDNNASSKGSYLAFTADMAADATSEITLTDVAEAEIPVTPTAWADVQNQVTAWVQAHPKTDTTTSRIWIQAVVLTKETLTDSTTISSDASGQVGAVVGVAGIGGSLTVKHMASTSNKSVLVAFDGFDIDRMAASATGPGVPTASPAAPAITPKVAGIEMRRPPNTPQLPNSAQIILAAARYRPANLLLKGEIQITTTPRQ